MMNAEGMMIDESRHRGRNGWTRCQGFACSHQGLCFAHNSSLFIPAKDHRGAGAWQTGSPQWYFGWGPLPRSDTRKIEKAEFVSKIEVLLQELSETVYWLELLVDAGIVSQARLTELLCEGEELTAIFVASAKTAKSAK